MAPVIREVPLPSTRTLKLVRGDLTEEAVDAIVNAANALRKAGTDLTADEVREHFPGDDGRLAIDTPEMAKTLEYYGGLIREYGPPGVSNFDDRAVAASFQQGQAAIMTDLNHFQLVFNDPAQSPKTAGKVRVAYRVPQPVCSDASKASLKEVENLLDGIAREALGIAKR